MIKSQDELTLLNMAAPWWTASTRTSSRRSSPASRENEIVALAQPAPLRDGLRLRGGDQRHLGERCSPHPHNFTDRIIRPGDQAFFDIIMSSSAIAPATTAPSAWARPRRPQQVAYKKAREWMDEAIALIKPGVTHRQDRASLPEGQEIGFDSEMAAFGLNFCHGIGLGCTSGPSSAG
jgi:Xaa-Pro dipeptidase